MRIVNRSSCASGSGYVPSYSIGFCVAITMNGRPSPYEVPSTVTCCSCMHSSSAAWVFGDARLISSTSRRLAKTGPGLNSNAFARWSKTLTPVTSDGRRSGVNCKRENEALSERASALASIVFPTPGKSSRIRWPSLTRQRTQSSSVSDGAWMTRRRFALIVWIVCAADSVRARVCSGSCTVAPQQLLGCVDDRGGDRTLRGAGDAPLPGCADEDDLVVLAVEPDPVLGHVVVDDEVDVLRRQLLAGPLEPVLALVGREGHEPPPVRPSLTKRPQDVGRRLELDRPALVVLRALVGA